MGFCGIFLLVSAIGLQSTGAEGPAIPSPRSWRLDVEFHDIQRLDLALPGDRSESVFWYMLYRVTNNTGEDIEFYPSIRLVTDTLEVTEAGAEVHPMVYDVIAARHRQEYPFMAPPTKVTGKLLQGEENSRASVAVFRQFDPNASSFTIFAAGFSGEMMRIPNAGFEPNREVSEDNTRAFLLRRTLAIRYDLPGDATTRVYARPVRQTREWVMR